MTRGRRSTSRDLMSLAYQIICAPRANVPSTNHPPHCEDHDSRVEKEEPVVAHFIFGLGSGRSLDITAPQFSINVKLVHSRAVRYFQVTKVPCGVGGVE